MAAHSPTGHPLLQKTLEAGGLQLGFMSHQQSPVVIACHKLLFPILSEQLYQASPVQPGNGFDTGSVHTLSR